MNFPWDEALCLGVAGNIAGHLEQAGEAAAFAQTPSVANRPKGLFATYLPGGPHDHFLSLNPLSDAHIVLPVGQTQVQIEPELALVAKLRYGRDGRVTDLDLMGYCAYNDVSIRDPLATKISHKKNWGPNSKAFGNLIPVYDAESVLFQNLSIASYHRRDGQWHVYGVTTPVLNYTCFGSELVRWIVEQINVQDDQGQLENINALLDLSNSPEYVAIGCGATTYTPWGETQFLAAGDVAAVVVFDHRLWSEADLLSELESGATQISGQSVLVREIHIAS